MAENYNYQYIENSPQQTYTTKNEVIYQYPIETTTGTTTNYYTYDIPTTNTTTHNYQNVQYQEKKAPAIIYTTEPNKTKTKNQEYIYEYPLPNNKTNQQVLQNNNYNYQNVVTTNTNNTVTNYNNNINYGVQQVHQVKPNKNDNIINNKYIIPQGNVNTQQPKQIKQNPQYQQNQRHHHTNYQNQQQQQYIYQNNNVNYINNKNNVVQQYPQKIQQQIQPKPQAQILQNQNQNQKNPQIQNKTINQFQQINPNLNKLNPKTQVISNPKNNILKNYQIPQQQVLQPNQIINQKNPIQINKNSNITNNQEMLIIPPQIPNQNQQRVITTNQQMQNQNQLKINAINQPYLQNKIPNQNIPKNINPQMQHESQKYQVPIKYNNTQNQIVSPNTTNIIPHQNLGNNVPTNNPQIIKNNNNVINQYKQNKNIMPKMQMMPLQKKVIPNNNQNIALNNAIPQINPGINIPIQNQNIALNNVNPQVNILKNIPPQNQMLIQNNQNNNNVQYKLDRHSARLNPPAYPIQQNLNNIQPQIQNMSSSQKLSKVNALQNLGKKGKKLSVIKEEDSCIRQSGFDRKDSVKINNDLNQKVDIEKNIDNNFKESKLSNNQIDIDDKLERLPLIDDIMKGLADLLPPCKKKKYF